MKRPSAEELFSYAAGLLSEEQARQVERYLQNHDTARQELQEARRLHTALMRTYERYDRDHDRLREQLMSSLPPGLPAPQHASEPLKRAGLRLLRYVAVLAIVLSGAWWLTWLRPPAQLEPEISLAELEQKKAEVLFVLGWTSRQLQRAQDAAVRDVVGDQVAPAIRQIPIQWSAPHIDSGRI